MPEPINGGSSSSSGADSHRGTDASIVICTRDHCASLRRTLESIAALDVPSGLHAELLVIDNGSTDRTADVVAASGISTIRVRRVYEPKAGLSHARNRGLAEAAGRAILWTDDDVVVPPNWLADMAAPILTGQADAVCGSVEIPLSIRQSLAGTALDSRLSWVASTELIDFDSPERMVGASMAFGRHVLSAVPAFDLNLDPGPAALGFGGDTLFAAQLRAAGYAIVGVRSCPVLHFFDRDRLTTPVILSMARRFGCSQGYQAWHWESRSRRGRIGRGIGAFGSLSRLRAVAGLVAAWRSHRKALQHARRTMSGTRLEAEEQVLREFWVGFRSHYLKCATRLPKYPA